MEPEGSFVYSHIPTTVPILSQMNSVRTLPP
jgi:hypothetical protein